MTDAPEKKTRNRGPNAVNASREITKGLDRVAVELLAEATSKGKKDPLPLAQRIDVFATVAKYLAIKNRGSADDGDKGEELGSYAEQLRADAGGGRTGRAGPATPLELGGSHRQRGYNSPTAVNPDANGGSLLAKFKSRIPTANDGSA